MPSEVNFVKVDAEGCDVEIFYSAQRLIQEGRVPFLTIEFTDNNNCQANCNSQAFLDHMYTQGYSFYAPYMRDAKPIPRNSVSGGTLEWWFVHADAAVLPEGWKRHGESL